MENKDNNNSDIVGQFLDNLIKLGTTKIVKEEDNRKYSKTRVFRFIVSVALLFAFCIFGGHVAEFVYRHICTPVFDWYVHIAFRINIVVRDIIFILLIFFGWMPPAFVIISYYSLPLFSFNPIKSIKFSANLIRRVLRFYVKCFDFLKVDAKDSSENSNDKGNNK